MLNYYKHLYLLVKRLLWVMLFLTITRLLFYISNYNLYESLTFWQLVLHCIYGLRFDLATIGLLNLPFVFFSVLPGTWLHSTWYQSFLKGVYLVLNIPAIALNMIDAKFYEFEGKRLSADFFTKEWLGNDFIELFPEFVKDFWFLFILFVLFVLVLAKIYPKIKTTVQSEIKLKRQHYFYQSLFGALALFLMVLFGRGGLQLKPIGIIAAAKYTAPEYIGLVLNSPFTIMKTLGRYTLTNPNYFLNDTVTKVFNPIHSYSNANGFQKKNVVIIILESFGSEYSGFLNNSEGFTPNLDSIMNQSLTFKNAYANGKRSIEALPSILSSIPAIMDNAFITSKYNSNQIESLADLLKKEGYQTSFYHGGKNGTMGFDAFTKLAGIDKYFGMDEYPNEKDYDGNWGVFDEPYLAYYCQEISQMNQPFFTTVFTLSSHHPYTIPLAYEDKFPKGNLINLESIGYADYALGKFFQKAAKEPWYKNTLFILTADHTAQSEKMGYNSNLGKYAVPLVFYAPGDATLKGVSMRVSQQSDIFPSVMDYLNYPNPFVAFGTSVFNKTVPGYAISYANGLYQMIFDNYAIHFNGASIVAIDTLNIQSDAANHQSDSVMVDVNEGVLLMKAVIQQFNVRMEQNIMKFESGLKAKNN